MGRSIAPMLLCSLATGWSRHAGSRLPARSRGWPRCAPPVCRWSRILAASAGSAIPAAVLRRRASASAPRQRLRRVCSGSIADLAAAVGPVRSSVRARRRSPMARSRGIAGVGRCRCCAARCSRHAPQTSGCAGGSAPMAALARSGRRSRRRWRVRRRARRPARGLTAAATARRSRPRCAPVARSTPTAVWRRRGNWRSVLLRSMKTRVPSCSPAWC